MKFILNWILSTLAIIITGYLINSFFVGAVVITPLWSAVIAALVLGIVNTLVRPVMLVLTLPITILTLGIFVLVINALMIMLASWLVPGFAIAGFWVAFLFSLILSVVNWFLHKIT